MWIVVSVLFRFLCSVMFFLCRLMLLLILK